MAQDALDRWWWPSLMMFGPPDKASQHSDTSTRWKIKRFSNDELRQKFVDATVPQAQYLGLTIPDPGMSRTKPATGISARSTGRNSTPCWPATARATGPPGGAAQAHDEAPGCARRLRPMPRAQAERRPKPREISGRSVMATLNIPLWEVFIRSRTALRTSMSDRCTPPMHAGAAGRARHLHKARRGPVDLGGAVERHHRLRSAEKGMMFEPAESEDLPPSDLLRCAGRSRTHVISSS